MRSQLSVGLTGGLLSLMLVPAAASAGTATIYQCGPQGGGQDLMTIEMSNSWLTSTGCGADGTGASTESLWPKGANPGVVGERPITFTAPGTTRFVRARFTRRLENYYFGDSYPNDRMSWDSYALGYRLTTDSGRLVERCGASVFPGQGPGNACSTSGEFTPLTSSSVDVDQPSRTYALTAGCYRGDQSCLHYYNRFALRGVTGELVVEDTDAPVVAGVSGPANSTSVVTRLTDEATLSATDDGGLGLLAVRASIDGRLVSETPWQVGSATCVDRDPGAGHAYVSGHPCATRPSPTTIHMPDTSDGQHVVKLEAIDAAGNSASALERTVTFDRKPPVMNADPVVVGVAQVGGQLTCSVGDVDGQDPALSFRWLRTASDGSNAVELPDAAGPKYSPLSSDVGSKLLCRVTAQDQGGAASRTSALSSGAFADGRLVGGAQSAPSSSPNATTGLSSLTLGTGAASAAGPSGPGSVQGPATPAPGCPVGTLVTLEGSSRLVSKRATSSASIAGAVRSGTGAPAPGVVVDLIQRVRREGVAPVAVASGTSGLDGRFALKAPVGASRDLQVVTRACGASGPVVGQSVRGQLKLRAVNPRLRNGQTVRFTGQAVGGYYGKGVGLELQVLVGRKWQDVRAVRTDAKGRFKTSYRFKRTYVRYTYRFRVITRATAGWPFTATRSPITKVRVN